MNWIMGQGPLKQRGLRSCLCYVSVDHFKCKLYCNNIAFYRSCKLFVIYTLDYIVTLFLLGALSSPDLGIKLVCFRLCCEFVNQSK